VKKESDNYFKTEENQYMADNREMHKIDEALYFVIEEKNNQ
jgi:preprotein translocase subunit SecA